MIAREGRIWEAASKDDSRPVLMGVFFDAKAATLTATNSYILARVSCEVEDGDESGLIPAEAIKAANGESLKIRGGKATLELKNGERVWNLLVMPDNPPDLDKFLADAGTVEHPFGLNPDLLKQLALALGVNVKAGGAAVLHPVHPLKGMRVTSGGAEGVLMPVRIFGSTYGPVAPDLNDDVALLAAINAARKQLDNRRGAKRALAAFRSTLAEPRG